MSRVSHPNTAFRSGTIAPAPPYCRVALIHTSPAAARDGTGIALNGGVGETPWGQTSKRPVTKIVARGWCRRRRPRGGRSGSDCRRCGAPKSSRRARTRRRHGDAPFPNQIGQPSPKPHSMLGIPLFQGPPPAAHLRGRGSGIIRGHMAFG